MPVRPFDEHVPFVAVGVHRLKRMEHAAVPHLGREDALDRLLPLPQQHPQTLRQGIQAALKRAAGRDRPPMILRRAFQAAVAGVEGGFFQPQEVGFQKIPGVGTAFDAFSAAGMVGGKVIAAIMHGDVLHPRFPAGDAGRRDIQRLCHRHPRFDLADAGQMQVFDRLDRAHPE